MADGRHTHQRRQQAMFFKGADDHPVQLAPLAHEDIEFNAERLDRSADVLVVDLAGPRAVAGLPAPRTPWAGP